MKLSLVKPFHSMALYTVSFNISNVIINVDFHFKSSENKSKFTIQYQTYRSDKEANNSLKRT